MPAWRVGEEGDCAPRRRASCFRCWMDGCIFVNFAFSSLQLQRQRHPSSQATLNSNAEEEDDKSGSSPNSEVIVPDYTVDSAANPPLGSTVVVDLLRRFPSDLIETSVDPDPPPLLAGSDVGSAAPASSPRVNEYLSEILVFGIEAETYFNSVTGAPCPLCTYTPSLSIDKIILTSVFHHYDGWDDCSRPAT